MSRIAVSFEADYVLDSDLGDAPSDEEIASAIQTELGFTGLSISDLLSWGWVND
jgi:hypothetical protein